MTRLLLVSLLAISVACVASYQQNILWRSGSNSYSPYDYGSGGYGSYWGSGSGSYYPFPGGLGGLSVYGNGGSSDIYGYSSNYPSNDYYGQGNRLGGGWYGQQQQVQYW